MTRAPEIVIALALLAALPLGACVNVPDQPETATQAPEPAAAAEPAPDDQPEAVAAVPGAATPGVARAPIVPLAKFQGLSDGQVTGMLGKPQFLRQDASVELWQYRAEGCVLHLFLYREKDGLRVHHAEMRPRTTPGVALSTADVDACLAKLAAAPPAATS